MAGVRSLTEAEDSSSSLFIQTGSGAHPASYTMGIRGSFPGSKVQPGMMLTTHPLLVPRLRKSRSYTSSHPNAPLWSITGPLYLFFTYLPCHLSFKMTVGIFERMGNQSTRMNCNDPKVHTNLFSPHTVAIHF
jgi:hypothetical protein